MGIFNQETIFAGIEHDGEVLYHFIPIMICADEIYRKMSVCPRMSSFLFHIHISPNP